MNKRNLRSQQQTFRLGVATLALLLSMGCTRTEDSATPVVERASDSPAESHFVDWMRAGLADKADFSAKIAEILMASGVDAKSVEGASLTVNPITEGSDQNRLKYWKDFLERDRLLDLSTLSAIMLVDATVASAGDSRDNQDNPDFSTFLFLKVESKPDWIFWVRQLHEGMSIKFDTSAGKTEFMRLARNGLSDKEDLTDRIRQIYSLEKKKQLEPGLTSYTVVSINQITDETQLSTLSGLLEGDSYLIPSRVEAVKIFDVEVDEKFEPARPEDGHGDAPHDGKNPLLLLFYKSKVSDSWIDGGEYL